MTQDRPVMTQDQLIIHRTLRQAIRRDIGHCRQQHFANVKLIPKHRFVLLYEGRKSVKFRRRNLVEGTGNKCSLNVGLIPPSTWA